MGHMMESGGGQIVNIGSTHAWSGLADLFPYSLSKGALLTLTHHIARNYAADGIRANWITVGWVKTPGEIEVWRRQGRDETWIEDKAREEATARVKALLDAYPVYPELDLGLLQRHFA